ncbi:RAD26-like SNF2 family DNA-dependent ATPase [Mycena amicta]|nr:RAD26-like SNF2 family DNA-dependent ATPase [Mycena amicta]
MAPAISAYAKRNSQSVAAPIDVDSDSDFNAGPVEQEELSKKKKRKSAPKKPASRRKSTPRDSDDEEEEEERPAKKKRRTLKQLGKQKARSGPNPLLAFFSMSTSALCHATKKPKSEPSYEADNDDDGQGDEEEEEEAQPVPKNTFAPYAKPKPAADSETESDSEMPLPQPAPQADDSVTESDTDPEAGSETESDDDYDGPPPSDQAPKPNFPIPDGQQALGAMTLDKAQGIRVPGAINTYLRPYQREGIEFFWTRYNENRGGLLGDDMGKTIQVIAFLSAIMKKTGLKSDRKRRRRHNGERRKKLPPANAKWPTALIIAPTSVVYNWEREFQTWGYFEVGCYVGPNRKEVLKQFKMGKLDVVITSHGLARRDIELLDDLAWSCIILDEAHNVKNKKAQTTLAYGQFECLRRFGLTGTAIQNSYDEFYTILDWTNPGKLGLPRDWSKWVTKPLLHGHSSTATEVQRYKGMRVAEVLKKKILPLYFLRREKTKVIADQMPKKTDQVVFCPLTSKQISVYKKILKDPEIVDVLRRKEPCDCGSEESRSKCCHPFDKSVIFKFLSLLIKLSNHLGLILPGRRLSPGPSLKRNRESSALAFPRGNAPTYEMAIMDSGYCGKWLVLMSLLKEWRADRAAKNKVLIFTKSVKLLAMMSFQLKIESISFIQLDGSTKGEDRMQLIDDFHDEEQDIFVFLISTMAGGTGLNLTGANKVVIFDPNWNPAHDLQAMDRAFRMGQRRDVAVFRLLGAGAVEELIYARQLYKQQQMEIGYSASIQTRYFEGVQGDKDKQGELFGLDNIFKLHEGGLSTKTAIENAHIAQLDWKLKNTEVSRHKHKRDADLDITGVDESQLMEGDDFTGLGALLFSDALPKTKNTSNDDVGSKEAMAGMYTHENPDLLRPNTVEQEQAAELKKRMRRPKKKSNTSRGGSPEPQWPPVRIHTKKPAPIKIKDRMKALIGIGAIPDASALGAFAMQFQTFTPIEQADTIRMCDEWDEGAEPDEERRAVQVELEPEDMDM